MTRCKVHPYETGVGVCAFCLRERLLALIAAQSAAEPSADYQFHHHRRSSRKSDTPPLQPPPLFPQTGVSYVSHRRSLDCEAVSAPRRHRHLLFYSTPQVGPTFASAATYDYPSARRPRRRDRFSLIKSLFGNPGSGGANPDPDDSKRSWLSALLRGHRRRRCPPPPAEARQPQLSDRGMSPAIDDYSDDSVSDSGYSTESSSSGWRLPAPTPMRRPSAAAATHHRHHHRRGVLGFAVSLSPLVRTTPGRQRRCQAAEVPISGELRHHHRHASVGTSSFGPNRSWKLADFGRFR